MNVDRMRRRAYAALASDPEPESTFYVVHDHDYDPSCLERFAGGWYRGQCVDDNGVSLKLKSPAEAARDRLKAKTFS